MDFTSINRLTGSLRRDVTTIIRPDFNDWIGARWRAGTGLFKAALLSFQTPAAQFGQISWPQQPRANKSHFLFAPSIQLTFNSYPFSNVFSESHTRNTSHRTISGPVFDVRNLLNFSRARNTFNFHSASFATSAQVFLARQYWPTLFGVKGQLHSPGSRVAGSAPQATTNSTTALHATESFFEHLGGMLSSRSVTRHSETTARPTLITISSSVRHWTQFLSNLLHRSTEHRHAAKSNHVRNVTNQTSFNLERLFVNENHSHESRREVREQLLSVRNGINQSIFRNFIDAALSFRSWVHIRTIDEATHSRQTFQKQLNNQFLLKQSLEERSFANVVQKFAVSKSSSNSETMARQVQYFGPPPDLTYAKNESPQFQQLVTALRDFRPAQNEIKAPAPQFPSIAQLTGQVRQELERELRIERERRGL
jgi:hypothetical protein